MTTEAKSMTGFDTAISDPPFYLWSFPGCPVRVRLSLALVERISAHLAPGAARAGLLLGKAEGNLTAIDDFQPLPSDSAPDVEEAVRRLRAEPDRGGLVGYYRTHHSDFLHLHAGDYALAEAFFRHPSCVFLLVRPCMGEAPAATFFFRDERGLNGDFPFLEFPFDAGSLAAMDRRAPDKAPSSPPADAAPAEPAAPVSFDLPGFAMVEEKRPSSGGFASALRRIAWLSLTAAAIGGSAYTGVRLSMRQAPAVAAAPAPSSGFELKAERQESDLRLTWNQSARVIANATGAVLSIQDGISRQDLRLTSAQVRSGNLLYAPAGEQVMLQLAVEGSAGKAEESVLVVIPKPAPAAAPNRLPAKKPQPAADHPAAPLQP